MRGVVPGLFGSCVLLLALGCGSGGEAHEPRFVPLGAEGVHDAQTQVVWTARDSGEELSWPEAERHCRELVPTARGEGWRLPSIEELASLYDESATQPCGRSSPCRVEAAVDLSSPYQWSATTPSSAGDRRFYFDFALGTQLSPLIRASLTRRALCTRSVQDDGSG